MMAVLTWWVLVQIVGLAALPLAWRLFHRLPDRGYGVSKALGMLLTGYLFWLLGILGLLRNDSGSILFAFAIVTGLAQLIYRRSSAAQAPISLLAWLRAHWKLVLVTEFLFAVTFLGWVLFRAQVPRILTAGGEKFMELAFLNSLKRSATMPPHDPWLSGFAISYYYFGYLMMSMLIRLSGVAPAVGFNVGGALLFALTATGAFCVVYNLVVGGRARQWAGQWARRPVESAAGGSAWVKRLVPVALLGVVFVVLLGNFEGALEVAHWNGMGSEGFWRWLDIADLDQPPPDKGDGPVTETRLVRPDVGSGWGWWWRASRVIFDYNLPDWPHRYDETADPPPGRRENIDEFPFFSFLLGDVHPHVLALPFIMLALTASLSLFNRQKSGFAKWELASLALIFGALGFLNTWDLPIQWAVAVAAYTLGRVDWQPIDPQRDPEPVAGQPIALVTLRPHLRSILTLALTLSAGALLLYAPFYIGFQSQAGGPLVHVHSSTRLAQFGVMFGPLLFVLIPFLMWGVVRARQRGTLALRTGVWTALLLLFLTLGILLATALAIQVSPRVRNLVAPGMNQAPLTIALRYLAMRLSVPWVTLLLVGIIAIAVALLRSAGFDRIVQFCLILVAAGAALILIPEYVYLKDVFGVRMNTVFKFYFQGWILWAVAAAGAVYALLVDREGLKSVARWLYGGGLVVVVGLGLIYPLLAISDRVQELSDPPTLDGTAYFSREQPADYVAIQWLNQHVRGSPVLLEKYTRGGYAYEGRVAAQTGLPTLVGWGNHEYQWRGNTLQQDQRYPVIEALYATTDLQRTLTLLDEYDITYVYVGPLERAVWPASGLEKFDRLMETVYDHAGVTIYQRRDVPGDHVGDVVLGSAKE